MPRKTKKASAVADVVPRRFVLLRHEGHGSAHFDFMIEDGTALATWQFDQSPALLAPGGSLACRRLPDHRLAYLDHEGPVSGGRGTVQREDSGPCSGTNATETRWNFELTGTKLLGKFRLTREGNTPAWVLTRD